MPGSAVPFTCQLVAIIKRHTMQYGVICFVFDFCYR